MAASHPNAIPCIMQNEGKKLYQMFQSLFTMTTLHMANLPTTRKEFYAIQQKDKESALQYTSRVDIIVATMGKLGEPVSNGAWIYALGHGLRPEYKETKDGISYNKDGYGTVLQVKTNIWSEDAILKDKQVDKTDQFSTTSAPDEIAMTVAALPIPSSQPTVDSAQFNKGKNGKNGKKGGPNGQRSWNDGNQWNSETTWQQQLAWPLPTSDNSWTSPSQKGKGWNTNQWQQPPNWSSSGNDSQWTPPSNKGKGSNTQKKQLWCDYHQAYGHSTDWCFSNPNRTGGPPKQEWCNHHQSYGHSTEACRKGNGAPNQDDSSKARQKGSKGKSKGNSRAWKSDNFPANYDQATPAINETKILQWWETEEELSSVCLHATSKDVNLAILDDASSFSEDLDEASADLLDLHFLAIIHQHERMQQFLLHPNVALQEEINTHEEYLNFANSLLDPNQQQIIARFQGLVTQDFNARINELNATDLNARAMNELDLVDLNVATLQPDSELNETDLNARELTDLDSMDLNVAILQPDCELNATDLNARAMNELNLVALNVATLQPVNELNATDLSVANLQTHSELNATDLNARTINELDSVDLNVAALQPDSELNETDLNARAMNEFDSVELLIIARFQNLVTQDFNARVCELNATDLHARATNEIDSVDLNVATLQPVNELNATDLNIAPLQTHSELNAMDLNARAMNELDLVDLNVVTLQPDSV
jgi:hypothetical protein